MEIFNLPRRMGGLERLVRMSQDKTSAIICSVEDMNYVSTFCEKENIECPEMISYRCFIDKIYSAAYIKTIRIHNIGALLEEIVESKNSKIKIETATLITKTVTE